MDTRRATFKKDKYYPKVTTAVNEILKRQNYVSAVDVYLEMGKIEKSQVEDWRRGRIPYLERVLKGNLSIALRILKILKLHAEDRRLKPSKTVYKQWGVKGKIRLLRFSKWGHLYVEELYRTHYVDIWPRTDKEAAQAVPEAESSDQFDVIVK